MTPMNLTCSRRAAFVLLLAMSVNTWAAGPLPVTVDAPATLPGDVVASATKGEVELKLNAPIKIVNKWDYKGKARARQGQGHERRS